MSPKCIIIGGGEKPVNTIPPKISITGLAAIGITLNTDDGTWINGVDTYGYQWLIDPSTPTGGFSNSMVATSGGWHRSRVTATNEEGAGDPADSSNKIYIPFPDPTPNNFGFFAGTSAFRSGGFLIVRLNLNAGATGSVDCNLFNTNSLGGRGHMIGGCSNNGIAPIVDAAFLINPADLTESPFISGDFWLNGTRFGLPGQIQGGFNGA